MIATLLRKPIKKTVAQNALENGCGGLNIDATRVGYSDVERIDFDAKQRQQADPEEKGWSGHVAKVGTEIQMHKEKGRWPANFVLKHEPDCELKGTKKVKGHRGYPNGPGGIWSKKYQENHQQDRKLTNVKTIKDNEAWVGHADKEGKETVPNWACVDRCPVKNLDGQSGVLKSGAMMGSYKMWGRNGIYSGANEYSATTYGDSGGASRYFKQVTRFRDLLDYLTTLITPPKEIKSNIFVGDSDVYLWTLLHKSLHGAVIRGEFTKEQAQSLIDCMLPGSHLVIVPYDSYNAQTIVHLEDCGLEVRDSIFIPEEEEFMYAKKASKKEREKGLEDLNSEKRKNTHPTVKPITIMEWCLRDIPKGDNVVDPFMGSGTTGIAARRQGYPFVGMEISPEYLKIARARIESAKDES